MARKLNKISIIIALIILSAFISSGCGVMPVVNALLSVPTAVVVIDPPLPLVLGPEAAREVALDFIRENYNLAVPSANANWGGGEASSGDLVGLSSYQYVADDWAVKISFPFVAPDATIYTIKAQSVNHGFSWEGLIDAYGQVATSSVSFNEPTVTPEVIDPDPVDPPVIGSYYFRDDTFRVAMEYPTNWSLTELSPGNSSNAKALRLQKGTWTLVIYYKYRWDNTTFGGGLPAGDVVDRGWTSLLGRLVPKHFVVLDGKDKVMWYGDRFEDLEFYIRLEADLGTGDDYYSVDIPETLQDEVENIVANIIRTGPPIDPPIPTPTPVPPTPTPVPVPCNAAIFQADLTIPDGTKFTPDTEFTKSWRLKNIGSCVWTTSYDLVFVEGDRMDGRKAIGLREKIRPGETLNISVELTSPQSSGDYRGYWMLRSDDGEWFGIGKTANKAFWVDIEVVKPNGDYVYDFAVNYCAATWRSEDMRLPCPGYKTSREGFALLLDYPKLENRREDQPAIWVHTNEERYGWLEGTYPFVEVEDGDHFKAWVGCLEGYNKCSLKFYLDYETENGKVRRLGEWLEVYEGQVTDIDLDLSELAGEEIRFILGVEAQTKNVDAAHGFWFVPRIVESE